MAIARQEESMHHSCRSEDDLTHKLAEIVKSNSKLKRQDQNGAPQHIIREFSQLLQFHITTYFDNTKPGQPVAAQVQDLFFSDSKNVGYELTEMKWHSNQLRGTDTFPAVFLGIVQCMLLPVGPSAWYAWPVLRSPYSYLSAENCSLDPSMMSFACRDLEDLCCPSASASKASLGVCVET